MLAIVGASGKIGYATLSALLDYNLISPRDLVCCTTSQPESPTWRKLRERGVDVRHADFDDSKSMRDAFAGCDTLYLVSTPKIELDFNDAAHGQGRERQHFAAIAAARLVGVKHIYYTSLAFQRPSQANLMTAHVRTEELLESLTDIDYTIIREGLYNESWPLYLGYYNLPTDSREELILAGDGPVSWTAIKDLGLGSALILAAPRAQYSKQTVYLSTTKNVLTIAEVASIVARVRSKPLALKVVSPNEHVQHYETMGQESRPSIKWWVTTYAALKDGEALITDSPLDTMLASKGVTPTSMADTVREMMLV